MFPTTDATTAPLSESARVGDRPTVPARGPSVGGIPSRAIGLPGTMFATLGVNPEDCLGPNPYHPSPKVQTYPWIKSFKAHFENNMITYLSYLKEGQIFLIEIYLF